MTIEAAGTISRRALLAGCAGFPATAAAAQQARAIPSPSEANLIPLQPGERLPDRYREIDPATGKQKGYAVLSEEERAKGFVRPVRQTYTHLVCGTDTSMSLAIAETFARNPRFYGSTFCSRCRKHLPVVEFVWQATQETVGS